MRLRALRARVDRYLEARAAAGAAQPAPPPVPPSALHGTYVGAGRVLVAPTWGGRLMLSSSDLSLMPDLVVHGTYDVPFTAFVREHIQPGDVAIDVGANVGLFTLLLAYEVWERGRVIAYEPSPLNLQLLRDNVAMNWLDDRVEIVPKAAAARPGRVELLAPQRFHGLASIQPLDAALVSRHRIDDVERIEVDAEPLDRHVGRFERIDLVKIDVEGAEAQVFAGMANLLESGVVRRVCFEMTRPLVGDDWDGFARRLKALEAKGWRFATIPESGIPEPAALDALLERGWWSQVAMLRPDQPS